VTLITGESHPIKVIMICQQGADGYVNGLLTIHRLRGYPPEGE
jgi:hypothetical protein